MQAAQAEYDTSKEKINLIYGFFNENCIKFKVFLEFSQPKYEFQSMTQFHLLLLDFEGFPKNPYEPIIVESIIIFDCLSIDLM